MRLILGLAASPIYVFHDLFQAVIFGRRYKISGVFNAISLSVIICVGLLLGGISSLFFFFLNLHWFFIVAMVYTLTSIGALLNFNYFTDVSLK